MMAARQKANLGWVGAAAAAVAFPFVFGLPYYVSIGITVMTFIALAVAFDLVVGRIGALSLCQPIFFGFGAYLAALTNVRLGWGFPLEAAVAAVAAVILALAIGFPAFRLSLHAFAIGTLGFSTIGLVVARNWVPVTGGPMCTTGIGPIDIGPIAVRGLVPQYLVITAIAALAVTVYRMVTSRKLGSVITAVRDDPVLAQARGFSPTAYRLTAFALSAALSAVAGTFTAHYLAVVCPDQLANTYMVTLLIIVFIGGRGNLAGVVLAAVLFGAMPELLRLADQWRLVIYGGVLLVVVVAYPDGLGRLLQATARRVQRRPGSASVPGNSTTPGTSQSSNGEQNEEVRR